jgi:hypothetical protein
MLRKWSLLAAALTLLANAAAHADHADAPL